MALFALWLADYQLLAAALLLGVMLALAALRQPAQRLAVAKSTLAALAALALLCALPGWLNAGVGEFEVQAGPGASLPDLVLTNGGVIRLQLIDDKSGRPVTVDEPLVANVSVTMKNKLGRQEAWPDLKKVSEQGVVEIASLPGTAQVMLQSIEAGDEPQWLPAANDWTAYPQSQVVEGDAVDAKIRVRRSPTTTNQGSAIDRFPKGEGTGLLDFGLEGGTLNSTWRLIPQPASINFNGAATLSEAVE